MPSPSTLSIYFYLLYWLFYFPRHLSVPFLHANAIRASSSCFFFPHLDRGKWTVEFEREKVLMKKVLEELREVRKAMHGTMRGILLMVKEARAAFAFSINVRDMKGISDSDWSTCIDTSRLVTRLSFWIKPSYLGGQRSSILSQDLMEISTRH